MNGTPEMTPRKLTTLDISCQPTVNLRRGIRTTLQYSLPHSENTLTQTQNIHELLYTADATYMMNSLPRFLISGRLGQLLPLNTPLQKRTRIQHRARMLKM
jgi:hypothetical protein